MYQNAAMLAAFLLIYSAVAGRIERSWISGPIVFTAVGFALGAVLVLDEKLPGNDTIILAAGWTVLLSVIAHRVTANLLVKTMAGHWGELRAQTDEHAIGSKAQR